MTVLLGAVLGPIGTIEQVVEVDVGIA